MYRRTEDAALLEASEMTTDAAVTLHDLCAPTTALNWMTVVDLATIDHMAVAPVLTLEPAAGREHVNVRLTLLHKKDATR